MTKLTKLAGPATLQPMHRQHAHPHRGAGCFLKHLFRGLPARLSAAFLLLVILAGALAPVLPIPDPAASDLAQKFAAPSASHWLGTDVLGRDLLSRIVWSARTSLFAALAATAATAVFGALYGGICAAAGRRADEALMRFCDLWMSFPSEVMILAVVGMLGPGLENVVLGCFIAKWPWYARMVRSIAKRLAAAGFVSFARVAGADAGWILWRHLLPNTAGDFFVLATIDTGSFLLMISSLSFLGLGVSPPAAEWGMMLADAKNVMTLYPWQMLPPGLAILGAVVSLHFLGDALADAFDPQRANRGRGETP